MLSLRFVPSPPPPTPIPLQRPLLAHYPHNRLDLAPRVQQSPTYMRPEDLPTPTYSCIFQRESPAYIQKIEDTRPVNRAIGLSHTAFTNEFW